MRLSASRVQALKKILKSEHGIDMTDEEAQQAGLAIVRFAAAKLQRNGQQLKTKRSKQERVRKGRINI